MQSFRPEPTLRRDRYYWGGSGDPQDGLTFVLLTQLGWPVALVLYLMDMPGEAYGLALLFAAVGLTLRGSIGHVALELWPPRRLLIWDPRGAAVACEITGLWVRNVGDGKWTVEITSDLPETVDGPRRRRFVLLERADSYEEAQRAAESWHERLKLPDLQVSVVEDVVAEEPAKKKRLPIAAFANDLGPDDKGTELSEIDISGLLFSPLQVFVLCLYLWMITGSFILKKIATENEVPTIEAQMSSLGPVLLFVLFWTLLVFLASPLRLDFRSREFERWRGPRFLAQVRRAPFSELKPLRVVEHGSRFCVLVDTDEKYFYGLCSCEHLYQAEELAAYWAERLGIEWISEVEEL